MDKESRSSFVLIIGFGILIVLIGVLGFRAVQRAESIYKEMQVAQNAYLRTEEFRRGFVSDMYLSDILVRDYLLDPSPDSAPARRHDVQAMRDSLQTRLDLFSAKPGEKRAPDLANLQSKVEAYWDSLDPIFNWAPKQRAGRAGRTGPGRVMRLYTVEDFLQRLRHLHIAEPLGKRHVRH